MLALQLPAFMFEAWNIVWDVGGAWDGISQRVSEREAAMPGSGTEKFATLLRALKDRAGLSYGALARRIDLSTSTLHRYCSGATVPADYAPIERFARLCKATPSELSELHRLWALAYADRVAATNGTSRDAPDAMGTDPETGLSGDADTSSAPSREPDDGEEVEKDSIEVLHGSEAADRAPSLPSPASSPAPVSPQAAPTTPRPPSPPTPRPPLARAQQRHRAAQAILVAAAASLTLVAVTSSAGPASKALPPPALPTASRSVTAPTPSVRPSATPTVTPSPSPKRATAKASPVASRKPSPKPVKRTTQPRAATAPTAPTIKTVTIRGHANQMPYLDVVQGQPFDGTTITTYGWSNESYGRNQWWKIHHFADGTIALESALVPGRVLDLDLATRKGRLWIANPGTSAQGTPSLTNSDIPVQQRWRIIDAGNGWSKIVSVFDGQCLYDRVTLYEPVMTTACVDGNVWQEWTIGNGPSTPLP